MENEDSTEERLADAIAEVEGLKRRLAVTKTFSTQVRKLLPDIEFTIAAVNMPKIPHDNRIQLTKLYRDRTGLSLPMALAAVDAALLFYKGAWTGPSGQIWLNGVLEQPTNHHMVWRLLNHWCDERNNL